MSRRKNGVNSIFYRNKKQPFEKLQKNKNNLKLQGEYGLLVLRGKYFVQVEKENYQTLKTKEFEVNKNFIN